MTMTMKTTFTPYAALAALMLLALSQTGCVQTQATRLTAEAQPPVPKEEVQVYRTPEHIGCAYDEVAIIHAQGDVAFTNEHGMIRAAKERAGEVGANGVVLGSIEEPGVGALAAALIGFLPDRRGELLAIFVHSPCRPLAAGEASATAGSE